MRKLALRYIIFINLFNALALSSCGKKKSDPAPKVDASTQIPDDWNLTSDYSTADLKAKDINP